MLRRSLFPILLLFTLLLTSLPEALAQVRAAPAKSQGGERQGTPWAEVPDTFRAMKLPDWPVPTNLDKWQSTDRAATRNTLLQLLGEMPRRPDPAKVEVISTEDKGTYVLERFRFHNGADMVVPGILLIPKNR